MIRLPQHPLPLKPLHGEPCNGCGLCCALEVCGVGRIAFPGASAPCPGMKFHDGRVTCELVEIEIQYRLEPKIQRVLGIGLGCSMTDEENNLR